MPGYSDYLALNLRVQLRLRLRRRGEQARRLLGAVQRSESQRFRQPENKRNTAQFNTLIIGGAPRTMQLGLRYSF